jgi:hypothetical protein
MLGSHNLKGILFQCKYVLNVLKMSRILLGNKLYFHTDFPDFSSPIINSLYVGVAKYQLIKPEIKENIF